MSRILPAQNARHSGPPLMRALGAMDRRALASLKSFVAAVLLTTAAVGQVAAQGLGFSSPRYKYTLSLPAGWMQIPDAELTRLKAERFPPQAQHLIFDSAFQRGKSRDWFAWPYVIVQVIPSERTRIKRLPTDQEFQQFVTTVSGGRMLSKVKEAIDAVKDPEDKAFLRAQSAGLTTMSAQFDVASRKYWFVIEGREPLDDPIKTYVAGAFMPDGSVAQINAYTKTSKFNQHLGQFLVMTKSLRAVKKP